MSQLDHADQIDALFASTRIVPVIQIDDAGLAVDLARTLASAGLNLLEITLRSAAAMDAINRIAREVPEAIVGAGTIRSAGDLARVADAGARFAIAPGSTETLYRASLAHPDVPLIPGVATASDIMLGLEYGFQRFKFFPARAAGGIDMLKSWAGPFPQVRFMPTGGIDRESASAYLALPNVMAVGGSWMVPGAAKR
ncbi:MAG: bifunctional 4-hydroxy-2-oxoglutarate aldolase/2-dehydro-3-deoxy-phosphogluconate aldolase [Wenzhouxiangella sp.]